MIKQQAAVGSSDDPTDQSSTSKNLEKIDTQLISELHKITSQLIHTSKRSKLGNSPQTTLNEVSRILDHDNDLDSDSDTEAKLNNLKHKQPQVAAQTDNNNLTTYSSERLKTSINNCAAWLQTNVIEPSNEKSKFKPINLPDMSCPPPLISNFKPPPLPPPPPPVQSERERSKRGLPHIRAQHVCICSRTLWLGHLAKSTSETNLKQDLVELLSSFSSKSKQNAIIDVHLIPPRGCAYVEFADRRTASKCLDKLKNGYRLDGVYIKVAWATNKGINKAGHVKQFWNVEVGCTFIPWDDLEKHSSECNDLIKWSEGGLVDEDSLPQRLLQPYKIFMEKNAVKDKVDQVNVKKENLTDSNVDMEIDTDSADQVVAFSNFNPNLANSFVNNNPVASSQMQAHFQSLGSNNMLLQMPPPTITMTLPQPPPPTQNTTFFNNHPNFNSNQQLPQMDSQSNFNLNMVSTNELEAQKAAAKNNQIIANLQQQQSAQQNYAELMHHQQNHNNHLLRFSQNPNLVQHFQLVQRPMIQFQSNNGTDHTTNGPAPNTAPSQTPTTNPTTADLLRHLNLIQTQNSQFKQMNTAPLPPPPPPPPIQVDSDKSTPQNMIMVNGANAAANSSQLIQLHNLNAAIQMRNMSQMNPLIALNQQHFQSQQNGQAIHFQQQENIFSTIPGSDQFASNTLLNIKQSNENINGARSLHIEASNNNFKSEVNFEEPRKNREPIDYNESLLLNKHFNNVSTRNSVTSGNYNNWRENGFNNNNNRDNEVKSYSNYRGDRDRDRDSYSSRSSSSYNPRSNEISYSSRSKHYSPERGFNDVRRVSTNENRYSREARSKERDGEHKRLSKDSIVDPILDKVETINKLNISENSVVLNETKGVEEKA